MIFIISPNMKALDKERIKKIGRAHYISNKTSIGIAQNCINKINLIK